MLYLRVSTLESFRRVIRTSFGDEAELVDRIRSGQWSDDGPKRWQMLAGTSFHRILEDPVRHRQIRFDGEGKPFGLYVAGEYSFSVEDVEAAVRHVGPGLKEVTGTMTFGLPEPVWVEGTADHVRGLVVSDAKTKFSTPDARDYEASAQWKLYLAIHGASVFRYNLFHFSDPKDGHCELRDVVSFKFWRYPGLEAECQALVAEFVDWADGRGLVPALRMRKAA